MVGQFKDYDGVDEINVQYGLTAPVYPFYLSYGKHFGGSFVFFYFMFFVCLEIRRVQEVCRYVRIRSSRTSSVISLVGMEKLIINP